MSIPNRKIIVCANTRPEIIKMIPVYWGLKKRRNTEVILMCSGQHEDLARQAFSVFGVQPDKFFSLLEEGKPRTLSEITSAILIKIVPELSSFSPDLVLVHGDTISSLSIALGCFFSKIPVGHVEAGLRTSMWEYPFPEEMCRRLIADISEINFSPTLNAIKNLNYEGISSDTVLTGNTVVDSLQYILSFSPSTPIDSFLPRNRNKVVLITCHRSESIGENLKDFCSAISRIARSFSNCTFVWCVHPNPEISSYVHKEFQFFDNILSLDALPYDVFVHLLNFSDVVITDSGGVLEEASVLNVPTLVLRSETERPEAVSLDNVELVGYNFSYLESLFPSFLNKKKVSKFNFIFGDGHSGDRISKEVFSFLNRKGWSRNKGRTRIHSLKDSVFSCLYSPEQAYWLGILYTDGWVTSEGCIGLASKDYDLVSKFRSFVESSRSIRKRTKIVGEKAYVIYEFTLNSLVMLKSLSIYGIIPNKTYDHSASIHIPLGDLSHHFWRGCLDGDGCISLRKNNYVSIVLSNNNLELLNSFLKYTGVGYISKNGREARLDNYSPQRAFDILYSIYECSSKDTRLDRKFEKYLSIKKIVRGTINE